MSARTQEQQLLTGQAATVVGYPPELAQASAVTARVQTPNQDLPDTGSAGAVDTLSTTLGAAASRGTTLLTLAGAVALVRGRQYVITDATTGARVVVESTVTATAAVLKCASPIPMDIAVGSAVVGYAVTFALTADQVGIDPGRGVVVWSATINGVVVTWAQDLRVERRRVAYTLTASDVAKLSPYSMQMRPGTDEDFTESIDAAWQLWLVPALLGMGAAPERIISWEAILPWHLAALEHHLAQTTPEPDPEVRAEKKGNLVEQRDLAKGSMRFWVDTADDVSAPADDPNDIGTFATTYMSR